jgi:hypothetical protein
MKNRRWIDRIHPVLFVDRLAADDSPTSIPLFEEIIETAEADHIHQNVLHRRALVDGHLDLRDGAIAGDVAGPTAEQMKDIPALIEKPAACFNEFRGRSLESGGGHPAVRMPDGGKSLPVPGIAIEYPVFHKLTNN